MSKICYPVVVRIVLLVAGTNDPSNADRLADAFAEGAKTLPGTDVDKVRLKDIPLEHFALKDYACSTQGPEFNRIRSSMQSADGIVIASPIWNFSVPAHLKNLLDHIGCFALDAETRTKGQLKGVPCYFIFTGGAPKVAWKGFMRFTTMHVREAMRYFGASPAGTFFEGKCMQGRGKFGLVVDQRPSTLAAVRARGEKFARVADYFQRTGKLPFTYRVIGSLYALGQRILGKL